MFEEDDICEDFLIKNYSITFFKENFVKINLGMDPDWIRSVFTATG